MRYLVEEMNGYKEVELACWSSCRTPGSDSCHYTCNLHRHPRRHTRAWCCLYPLTGTPTYAQKSWGGHTRCDLAPQSTSFGTVALQERQHLAMAGSRHLHDPLHATAHCAARAIYHVPHCCSVLAEVSAADNGNSYSVRLGTRGVDTKAVFPGYLCAAWLYSGWPCCLIEYS